MYTILINGMRKLYDGSAIVCNGKAYCNASREILEAGGYEPQECAAVPRVFSKMKLVAALMALGYWTKVKAWIEAQGLTDLYLAAQVVEEDNPYFTAGLAAVKKELGVTDAQAEEVLSQCVAE